MLQKFLTRGAQFHSAARGKLDDHFSISRGWNFDWIIHSFFCSRHFLVNPKFPEGTVAGLYKAAVAVKPEYDCVRVDSQRINWSLKELDVSVAIKMMSLSLRMAL